MSTHRHIILKIYVVTVKTDADVYTHTAECVILLTGQADTQSTQPGAFSPLHITAETTIVLMVYDHCECAPSQTLQQFVSQSLTHPENLLGCLL